MPSTQYSVTGTLTGAQADQSASCGGSAGRDLAYSFSVSATADVTFLISSIGGSSAPVGSIFADDCVSELRCNASASTSSPVRLAPGSYRLIVDALSSTATGSFTATVTVTSPAPLVGDTCSSAEVLTLTSGSTTVSGTTNNYGDDFSTSQCSSTGGDRYYRLSLSTTSNLTATVSPSSSSSAGVYLLSGTSCGSALETSCQEGSFSGSTTTLSATALAAGQYYLVVKNLGSGDGAFTLSVSTSVASIPGDTCSSPAPLTFFSGSASATGTVVGAMNDRSPSCASSSADVVYSFTVNSGQVLTATVTPTSPSPSWRPVVSLVSGTCSAGPEQACGNATSTGGTATLTSAALTAGTYFLWVDSTSGFGSGTFLLSATLSAGSTAGDTCSAPIPLTFVGGSASVSGTTVGAFNDHSTSLCSTTAFSGADVVYSFVSNGSQTFSASVVPSGSFRPGLSLRGPSTSCLSASEFDCRAATFAGNIASIPSTLLSAGTWYLWVDGVSGSSGTFSLAASLSGGSGTGETCASPTDLTFISGSATVSGTTTGATHDHQGSCGGSGPDRVYRIVSPGTRSLSVTVTPSASYRPVLFLVTPSTCITQPTANSDLACFSSPGQGSTATLNTTVSAGTYLLVVDTHTTFPGSFTLNALLQ